MFQESSQESKTRRSAIIHQQAYSSALGAVAKKCLSVGSIAIARVIGPSRGIGGAVGWRCRVDGEELLQQGLHLALHGLGSSYAALLIHKLEQDTKVSIGIMKEKVAEDVRQGR